MLTVGGTLLEEIRPLGCRPPPFEAVRFPYSAEALVNLNRFIDGLLGPWLSTSEDANV